MSEAPRVSCVIPTFESLDLVSQCLTSVQAQRGVQLDIIVSDDSRGSSIRDHVCRQPGVSYLEGARTGNPVDNWNRGLASADAAVRVLVHQDETLADPFYLRDAALALAAPNVAAAIGRVQVTGGMRASRHGLVSRIGRRLPWRERALPLINWIGPTAAFVFRGGHRFDRDLVQLADVEFYLRVLRTGRAVVLPGARVASRGYHAEQITASIDPVALALEELDRLARRTPPAIGPVTHATATFATRMRRWSR